MPVVGHAIVGIAAALTTGKTAQRTLGVWALCLVFLSYFPDIVEHSIAAAAWPGATAFSHSIPFGIGAGIALAPVLARVLAIRWRLSAAIASAAFLVHDFLDMLQSPDRMPLWPISMWRFSAAAGVIPHNLLGEILVLSPLVLIAYVFSLRRAQPVPPARRGASWAWVIVIAIVGLATAVNYLRDVRREDLVRARALVADGDFVNALAACDRADRWPATAAPGRVDYIRAEAWLGLRNRDRAEHYYLLSRRLDSTYFWTVADLAVLYASGAKPLEQRRRDVAPWLELLESDFAWHPALPRTVERVRRTLQTGG